ncbi:hypothetical protein [Apilactobacillus xinyiensis]|uniref:hypothetical protein n=1 Tax=Apilactobacillus xinyiensis TaxID=2841032 RepID=UPI001C7D0A65|nr:hypothetical protein [Apilactobacillus xinyiensis]MCL0311541.1 hypothetical protein [Apilactobacillus xinyiensis]MCL0318315.1 hypothetical protein [Apilactobacillus xinyiensis]MCL0330081.1 hypothetical protein [Apilactobacillus xinyiensis]
MKIKYLIVTILSTVLLFTCVANVKADKHIMLGSLSYHKVSQNVNLNKNTKNTLVYNHVPNSNYKNIKPQKLNKLNLHTKNIHVDCVANQGTRYNWYRLVIKHNPNTVKKYWIYGDALK